MCFNPRSTGVSGHTRRAWGGGVNIIPPPSANSGTSSRSEDGEAAIDISQRVLSEGIKKNLKKVASHIKVRSKVKTVTFRLIDYWDVTNNSCKSKLCPKASQGMTKAVCKYGSCSRERSRSRSGQVRSPYENVACLSCDPCFMCHLERGIRWWRSVWSLTQGTVNIRSKRVKFSKSKFSSKNMPILSSFVSELQKCDLLCTTIRNAKKCISKSDVMTFTWFFDHCTAKYKDIALKFCMCVVCM